ncbi:DUF6242 domain-containing protein [Phocaeicola sp.]
MKIKFLTVITGLLMAAFMITSCLDNNETETVYSSNASITAFSIGNIETQYTANVNGKDTTLTATVTGTDYPFVIDQGKHLIYNVDSLPVGTDVSKVVANITADTPYIFIVAEENDSLWTEGDSLNFEKPVFFKVMAYDMSYGDKYEAKINVHNVVPDSLMWSNLNNNNNFAGNRIQAQKALYFNNRIYVFAEQTTQVQVTSTAITDGRSWSDLQNLDIPEKAVYSSAMAWGDHLYIVAGKSLYSSTNGEDWTKIETGIELKQLVSNIYSLNNSENDKLVAIDSNNHFVESHNGIDWTQNEEVPEGFPQSDLSFASYALATNKNIDRMVLMGENEIAADTASIVWTQLSTENTWGDYSIGEKETRFCPKLEHIAMIHYNDQLYAFGGKGKKNDKEIAPFSTFYESLNHGVTWMPVTKNVSFPKEFTGYYEQANGNYSFTVDSNNYLWIMWSNGGGVWRGRINKLAFK